MIFMFFLWKKKFLKKKKLSALTLKRIETLISGNNQLNG